MTELERCQEDLKLIESELDEKVMQIEDYDRILQNFTAEEIRIKKMIVTRRNEQKGGTYTPYQQQQSECSLF